MEAVFFWVFAVVSVVAGVLVITRRNPVTSALWLVVLMFCLAGLFLLLHGFFLAVAQIIVYAGAIMVLFLFVIMLLNLDEVELRAGRPTFLKGVSVGLAGILVLLIVAALLGGRPAPVGQPPAAAAPGTPGLPAQPAFGEPEALARLLFTDFLIPFEVASILLLAAMVGAVVLAKRELRP